MLSNNPIFQNRETKNRKGNETISNFPLEWAKPSQNQRKYKHDARSDVWLYKKNMYLKVINKYFCKIEKVFQCIIVHFVLQLVGGIELEPTTPIRNQIKNQR